MSSSDRPFTVRIRIGSNEIEVSGSPEDVVRTLGNVSDLISKVTTAFGNTPNPPQVQDSEEVIQLSEEFPSVAIDPSTSCPDAIIQLLSTDWGRRKPRTLGELLAAMKVNAMHYPEGTVKGRLTDLTKRGVLRRIRSGRGYEYILIKP